MKKTISLLLCAAMTAGVLSGCGQKDTASETVRTECGAGKHEWCSGSGAEGRGTGRQQRCGCDTLWNYRIPEFPSGRSSGSV